MNSQHTGPVTAVLCDMNGLFRHWHNTGARAAENAAGLPDGTIAAYAYQHPAYRLARVGVLTDQQWADDVADRLAHDHGPHVRDALPLWRTDRGTADTTMIDLLAQVRRQVPVGVLSNCTDALAADLDHHQIAFDHVLPSALLGADKPSPLAFRAALQTMGHPADRVLYFDDEPTFVTAATRTGLHAYLFQGPHHFARTLRAHGLDAHLPAQGAGR
jgi:HAD superfamily hydrolase (TIGR01509 family)